MPATTWILLFRKVRKDVELESVKSRIWFEVIEDFFIVGADKVFWRIKK
ncbi:hypothetical protein ES703_64812 [subsurface metagenome]